MRIQEADIKHFRQYLIKLGNEIGDKRLVQAAEKASDSKIKTMFQKDKHYKIFKDAEVQKLSGKQLHGKIKYDQRFNLSNEGKVNEANQYKEVSAKFKAALDKLSEKNFTPKNVEKLAKAMKEKRPDAAMAYAKEAFGWMKNMKEGKLNEDVWKNFIVDLEGGGKLLKATNTDNRKTVKARSTSKVWDDGVPVLKYIARASKKSSPFPKGKFKVAHDTDHGWWYYQLGKTWYGIDTKDYSTPPFEY